MYVYILFFFFKQKTAYEMLRSLVGSEMCIRDRITEDRRLTTGNRALPTYKDNSPMPPAPHDHDASLVQEGSEHHRRRWIALLILSLSLTLVIMDGTIVNVAIPSITRDFGASFRDVEWVNTIYSLVYAATLILWGKIGDQYGRRLLFLIGVVIFGVGSALVGASSSIKMLVAMRALQGIGAGFVHWANGGPPADSPIRDRLISPDILSDFRRMTIGAMINHTHMNRCSRNKIRYKHGNF